MRLNIKNIICAILLMLLCACTATTQKQSSQALEIKHEDKQYLKEDPAVVDYIWEEPMVDVVKVPPGLDPEGIYYRPEHKEVIEIRQGKWQYYKKPQE
ncbi:MAG: hypothetical protein ACOX3T_07115 [Bdellovibrionota bacterium]